MSVSLVAGDWTLSGQPRPCPASYLHPYSDSETLHTESSAAHPAPTSCHQNSHVRNLNDYFVDPSIFSFKTDVS